MEIVDLRETEQRQFVSVLFPTVLYVPIIYVWGDCGAVRRAVSQ